MCFELSVDGGQLKGNPEALLAERKRKLKAAGARRKEVNRCGGLTEIGHGLYHFAAIDFSIND